MFAKPARIAATLAGLTAVPALAFAAPAGATSTPNSGLACGSNKVSVSAPQVHAQQAFRGSTSSATYVAQLLRWDSSRGWVHVMYSKYYYAPVVNSSGYYGGDSGTAGPWWNLYSERINQINFPITQRGHYMVQNWTADPYVGSTPSWTAGTAYGSNGGYYCSY